MTPVDEAVDKTLSLADQAAYEERIARQRAKREDEERRALARAMRERQQRLMEAHERAEKRRQEEFNAQVVQRRVRIGVPSSPQRTVWTDDLIIAEQQKAAELERERTERIEAKRKASMDAQQAALRAWAAQRDVLRAKVKEADQAMQQARGEMDTAIGRSDFEWVGRAKATLEGAEEARKRAQADLNRHQAQEPAVVIPR